MKILCKSNIPIVSFQIFLVNNYLENISRERENCRDVACRVQRQREFGDGIRERDAGFFKSENLRIGCQPSAISSQLNASSKKEIVDKVCCLLTAEGFLS